MIVHFNKEEVKDTGSDIQVRGQTLEQNGATPCEVIFMISYDNLDNYIGDHRGYWGSEATASREAFARSDDYFPLITSACAYATLRLPEILSLTEPNYIYVMPEDFPPFHRRAPELVDQSTAEVVKNIIVKVMLEDWDVDFEDDPVENARVIRELANDIYLAIKEEGYL